jgi:probable LLM family oxidoreductase
MIEIGIDSFVAQMPDPDTGGSVSPAERVARFLEEVEIADRSGIHIFGVGEHHRSEFLDSAPSVLLGAAAARTKSVRLTSAVTVLSAADPVRVFQDFATLDLISRGRAEIVVGRGSFGEAYPLFGFNFEDYDDIFGEKLGLLLRLRSEPKIHWSGRFRPPLTGQGVYPRPLQESFPIWVGVGGSPRSFARAGALGLPLMIAIIGGDFARFRPLVDIYRRAALGAGHPLDQLRIGVHVLGFVGESTGEARDAFFPGWAQMFTEIGRERGWQPVTRRQFDSQCEPGGAFFIGDPETVARKVIEADEALGGLSRVTFQMSSAAANHRQMDRSIELLGREVTQLVRKKRREPTLDRLVTEESHG